MYRYFGMLAGKLKAVVALTAVALSAAHPNQHAAVWLGASTHNARNWVQAGIEQMGWQPRPSDYIEIGRNGRQVYFWSWPIMRDHRAKIRLYHRGPYWRVVVDGHASRRVYLPNAATYTLLETYSSSRLHATALIDGRKVSSR